MGDQIILDGRRFPCRAPVLTWETTGLEFEIGRGARRQTSEIDLFVAHWTGGENEPPQMFRTLERRKLAIEFAIGTEETTPGFATVFQFCDPIRVDAFGQGKVNRRAMGCEIVNYGFRRPKFLYTIPKKGRARERYETRFNGRKRTFARFYPHQIHSVIALLEAVIDSKTTRIERAIPAQPHDAGAPLNRVMTDRELSAFRGVVGHNHVSAKKSDPGTDIMWALLANGFGGIPIR